MVFFAFGNFLRGVFRFACELVVGVVVDIFETVELRLARAFGGVFLLGGS